jgi:cytochrome c
MVGIKIVRQCWYTHPDVPIRTHIRSSLRSLYLAGARYRRLPYQPAYTVRIASGVPIYAEKRGKRARFGLAFGTQLADTERALTQCLSWECDLTFRRRSQRILAVAVVFLLSACVGEVNGVPGPRPVSGGRVLVGHGLIARYGCGSCLSIPGVPGANTNGGASAGSFLRAKLHCRTAAEYGGNLLTWIQDPQQIEPGTAMPKLEATQDKARDIAAYLYHSRP